MIERITIVIQDGDQDKLSDELVKLMENQGWLHKGYDVGVIQQIGQKPNGPLPINPRAMWPIFIRRTKE